LKSKDGVESFEAGVDLANGGVLFLDKENSTRTYHISRLAPAMLQEAQELMITS
jgi:hypothetical protein